MPQAYKNSFLVILGLIFLFPIFFVPGGVIALSSTKSAILSLGVSILSLLFLYEAWKKGSVSFPNHYLLIIAAFLPVVYLLSALLATPSSLSLLGYNFEVGTFGFILLGMALLLIITAVFANHSGTLQALAVLFSTLSLVVILTFVKVLYGAITGENILVLGNFFGNMGNPLGAWTDIVVMFGALAILIALSLGMIPMKKAIKVVLYTVFALSTILLMVINFSTAWFLVLVASIISWLYFSKVENHFLHSNSKEAGGKGSGVSVFARPTFLPIVLSIVSIIFIVNPMIPGSGERLGILVAQVSKVSNTDVRPSLGATLSISKAVLSQASLLGSGPNTFGQDWLIFKPVDVNTTPFWSAVFPFGIGFLPTQIATTGILGSAVWLVFLVLLAGLCIKAFSHIPEARAQRFALVSTMLLTLFLWIAAIFHAPSMAVLVITLVMTGLFVAVSQEVGVIGTKTFSLKGSPQNRLVAGILLAILAIGTVYLGWIGLEKTIAAYHFQKAARLSNTEGTAIESIENQLNKAVKFSPVDTHFLALSRLNFAKAQVAANSATGTPETNRAIFQESLSRSIAAARAAVTANPAGFGNWVALGQIYSALVPEPLKVEGAYENARFAYSEALKRNPNNPELPLLLAQLELSKGDTDAARSYIRNSIALKEDYADAYLALAQLEIQAGNTAEAIRSAEAVAVLVPNNPGVHFELGLLKYSNGDYEGAEKAFNRALTLSPQYANAKYYLGLTLARLGRFEEAKTALEALVETNPNNAELKAALNAVSVGKLPPAPQATTTQ